MYLYKNAQWEFSLITNLLSSHPLTIVSNIYLPSTSLTPCTAGWLHQNPKADTLIWVIQSLRSLYDATLSFCAVSFSRNPISRPVEGQHPDSACWPLLATPMGLLCSISFRKGAFGTFRWRINRCPEPSGTERHVSCVRSHQAHQADSCPRGR